MSPSKSYQLPDLLNIIEPLELRTNRHCRFATDASEQWISLELQILSKKNLSYLQVAKIGLLAALCFPTCDAPQLRLLTDFMTLLFYAGIASTDSARPAWWEQCPEFLAMENIQGSGIELLDTHHLLKHAIHPQITNLAHKAPPAWKKQFAQSVRLFRVAQEQLLPGMTPKSMSSVDEYLDMRRELHGSSMTFDIAELLQIFRVPSLPPAGTAILSELKRTALDVIAWSTDVVSYQLAQTAGNTCNLVAVLMLHRNLSVQGAMNLCGSMIRDAFEAFCTAEKRLLELLHPHRQPALPILSWVWKGAPSEGVAHNHEAAALADDVQRYIRALKDCIVGTIHWVYETELFFGKKGAEIRTFGWIFVDQDLDEP